MDNRNYKFRYFLHFFSLLYGLGVWIRNLLFEWNIFTRKQYTVPVICVGNLSAGGAGKTPLVEYLVTLLSGKYRVALISRGYKRKTSDFFLADENSTSDEVGDECCQIKSKYPDLIVAVDKNRCHGIERLLAMDEKIRPEVILMDDGFQHRYVRPSLSILVTAAHRLFYRDRLLPVGLLREPASAVYRSDIVVVSKCDPSIKPIDCRIVENEMSLQAYQQLYFSSIIYQRLEGVFPKECFSRSWRSLKRDEHLLVLTGIGDPLPLIDELKKYSDNVKVISYADHHQLTRKDVKKIKLELLRLPTEEPLIICTEKDAARFRSNPFIPKEWHTYLYYVPITINFMFDRKQVFDESILQHITTFQNSHILRK